MPSLWQSYKNLPPRQRVALGVGARLCASTSSFAAFLFFSFLFCFSFRCCRCCYSADFFFVLSGMLLPACRFRFYRCHLALTAGIAVALAGIYVDATIADSDGYKQQALEEQAARRRS